MRRLTPLLALVLIAAGCASSPGDAPSSSPSGVRSSAQASPEVSAEASAEANKPFGPSVGAAEPTPADINFAQMMIGHHDQAIVLVEMARQRSTNPELLGLADQIEAAQGPEIELMSGWVVDWGYDLFQPEDHVGHDMPGMLTADELAAVESAPEGEFDRLWLEAMIAHHEGAVVMAEDQLRDGVVPEVHDLSREIIVTQRAEIDHMRGMIDALG